MPLGAVVLLVLMVPAVLGMVVALQRAVDRRNLPSATKAILREFGLPAERQAKH